MSRIAAVASGLQAACLLARGRADGLRQLEPDMASAARSFWAIPIALPPMVALRFADWAANGGMPANAGRLLTLDLLVYLVSWLAFAVFSARVAERIGRSARWPWFISIWNWCNVVGNTMLLGGMVPRLLGAPSMLDQAAEVVVVGWALWLEWYATRLALGVGPLLAAWFVMLDQMIVLAFTLAARSMVAG